jgi:hypothetical protein
MNAVAKSGEATRWDASIKYKRSAQSVQVEREILSEIGSGNQNHRSGHGWTARFELPRSSSSNIANIFSK